MKIALVQMDASQTGPTSRMAVMEQATAQAASQGARVIVFPELAVSGYGAGEDIASLAGGPDGDHIRFLTRLASTTGCALVAGLALKDGSRVRNAAVFVTSEGEVSAYYKIHLYGDYEKALFARGEQQPPLVTFEGVRFGLLVCFDVEFPERVRDLAARGADAVLVPTALPKSEAGAFIAGSVIPVRAFENQLFIVYANHCGADARFAYQGRSCLAAPDGQFLARASGDAADIVFADIDITAYDACRAQNPYLEEVMTHCSDLGTVKSKFIQREPDTGS
ncbi:carbon-nitrogen hydrolase family protein [Stappia sp. ES.058]|uniref:carbon-nitrogen hydrolase family protein n=1 Tax=Stappia sp. ES.058 TaxID=1881061 RepID=UPI00087D9F79|nr:carbon-nitrogen hydrolase family protein [Stappia sp. ES.058]SDU16188.1 Predicted amidohydrolase [Stappia sp. ES.058]